MFGRVLSRVLTLVACLFALSFVASAQVLDQVNFSGKVTDTNGAIVAGATVTATQTQTRTSQTAVTEADGRYRLTFFESGPYEISITMQGFAVKKVAVNTTLGQALETNLQLAPAGVTAESTVTVGDDDAPLVDTTKTVAGGTITQREVEELPNPTRNGLDLVFTLGGVAEEPLSSRDVAEDRAVTGVNAAQAPLEAGIFSLSGGAAYSNNITVDGFDNNDDRLAQDRYRPSLETVREVQVVTNQFSAEYGRASGGRANIVTRGGSDKYHGRVYGFLSDAKFNANTYNNNLRGLPRLPFREWQPGATIGGPIPIGYFKRKTYWFVGYDYDQLHQLSQIDTVVPVTSPSFYTFPSATGGPQRPECTTSAVPPTCTAATNVTAGLTPAIIAPYITSVLTPAKTHTGLARIDHNFTSTNNFTIRYQLGRTRNIKQYRVPTNTLEDAFQGTTRDTDAINMTHNLVIGSRFTNQFRYQYSKFVPEFGSKNDTSPVLLITLNDRAAPTTAAQRNGTLVVGNSTAAANGNFSNNRQETRNQFSEEFTYIRGQMALRFGGDIQNIRSDYFALGDATGTMNFNSVADFLANRVVRFRRNFGTNSSSKNTYSGFFFQDDWRAKPNLSINFGIRKEFESILRDHNNWGPRLGIAFDPGGKSKSVFRFGAGIFYNRALLRTIDDFTLESQQLNFDSRLIPGPATDINCFTTNQADARCQFLRTLGAGIAIPTLEQLKSSTIPGVSTAFTNTTGSFARRLDPTLKIPESYQILGGYERQLSKQFSIEATFTWNRTIRLWREFNVNAFRLPSGFVDYNDYLIRGVTTANAGLIGNTLFENAGTAAADTRSQVISGTTYTVVNLSSVNNSAASGTPIGRARAALLTLVGRGVNNAQTEIQQVASLGTSDYKGLIINLRSRNRGLGLGFRGSYRVAYTLSWTKDDGLVNTSNGTHGSDFTTEFARSSQDRRHRLAFSGTFDAPWWLGRLRFAPVVRINSGAPFNLGNGGNDRNLDDVSNDRPNYTGILSQIKYRSPGTPYDPYVASNLSFAPIGSRGNLPRDAGQGPAQVIFDMNFSRQFKWEKFRIRPAVEMNNILNHTSYTYANDFIDFGSVTSAQIIDPNSAFAKAFLIPLRTLRARQMRFGIRIDF